MGVFDTQLNARVNIVPIIVVRIVNFNRQLKDVILRSASVAMS